MLLKSDIELALLKSCGGLKEASHILGVKYNTLLWNVKKYNIKFVSKKRLINYEKIPELYAKLQSVRKVAEELGCTSTGVEIVMKRYGMLLNAPIRYCFNERFFTNDNEKSFYWAGFIAADGCLKKNKKSNILSITLSAKDESHLEKFRQDIESNNPIHKRLVKNSIRNNVWNDTEKVEINLVSKYLSGDLKRFNIIERKTLIYTFPEWLINHPLCNHFMRGYFDGDGSWYIGSSKITPQIFFSLRDTVDFLKIYRGILENNGLPTRTKDPRINCGIGNLEYGGNGLTIKIRDFLYENHSVCLQRKFDLVKDIVTVPRFAISKEELQNLINELGQQKLVAKHLGMSNANMCRLIKKFNINFKNKTSE